MENRGALPLTPTRGSASGLRKGLRPLTLSRDGVERALILLPRVDEGDRGALPLTPARGAASGLRKGLRPLTLSRDGVERALILLPRVDEGDRGALPLTPARGAASGLRKGLRPLTLSRDGVERTYILFPRVDWSTKKAVRCLCRIALFRWILRMAQYPPHSARASFSVAEFASGWKKISRPSLLSRMKFRNAALVSCAKSP